MYDESMRAAAEQQRQEKQNYLRDNILAKEYDTVVFAAFMEQRKCKQKTFAKTVDDGMNIDNWTLEDLMAVVQEFLHI